VSSHLWDDLNRLWSYCVMPTVWKWKFNLLRHPRSLRLFSDLLLIC
jgi:hypothetical protein